ncbi:T9SS type A sorting domain-containing protein [bacterium]|nr:T9SS type A sorting domain-containing protein [bacterium]
MNWDISGPGKLTITYPDINLPDSSVSFLGSQGFFKFRVVMRDTVSNLTQSGSSAFIYFDNEAPIETNEPTIIAVDSIPVSELTATDAICEGESGLIDASISFGIGADSAYWSNGSTGLPLPYNDEGTYTVELVDEYGCRYLDSIAVSCNILTSIDENGEEFSVYPNPSNGKYYVNAKGNVRVFDVSGKEVYRTSSFNAPTEVDLSALPSGIYTIQLTNKGGVFTGKVVRE